VAAAAQVVLHRHDDHQQPEREPGDAEAGHHAARCEVVQRQLGIHAGAMIGRRPACPTRRNAFRKLRTPKRPARRTLAPLEPTPETLHGSKPLYKSLYFQVITAIVIGVLLGHFYPQTGEAMKPLGDGFIKLIKMIIAPIIFCTVVVGIAGMEDMKKVGKTGGLALLYFEVVSTIALIVGLVIINLIQPGAGMNIDPATLDTKNIAAYTGPGRWSHDRLPAQHHSEHRVDAFAKGEILQVLLFSVMFGFALHKFGGPARWCSTSSRSSRTCCSASSASS